MFHEDSSAIGEHQQAVSVLILDGMQGAESDSGMFGLLASEDAFSLRCCADEDPCTWNDIALVWPRYRFDVGQHEFADSLPLRRARTSAVIAQLGDIRTGVSAEFRAGDDRWCPSPTDQADCWMVIDLVHKRLFFGGPLRSIYRRRGGRWESGPFPPARLMLPPWWELHEQADPNWITSDRTRPIEVPACPRDTLWGKRLTTFFATKMLSAIQNGRKWVGSSWSGEPSGRYDLTLEIHREWLMTALPELGGRTVRECLHGAKEWIDQLAHRQRFHYEEVEDPIPVPDSFSNLSTATMGRHEVIIYFEACRYILNAGWAWLLHDPRMSSSKGDSASQAFEQEITIKELARQMDDELERWLHRPFEGNLAPAEIIRCDRDRIPLLDSPGVHEFECECPICELMSEGLLGPTFVEFDGHQLEIDEEFAFSMWTTMQDWQFEQDSWKRHQDECDEIDWSSDGEWTGDDDCTFEMTLGEELNYLPELALTGGGGSMGTSDVELEFSIAELIKALQAVDGCENLVSGLVEAFRDYRYAQRSEETDAANSLKQILEVICNVDERLVSRCADMQSRIDELMRIPQCDDHDIPF